MKIIYSAILMIGTLFSQIYSLPIIDLDPAIVVKQNKNNTTKEIIPPPPPPAPPGPVLINNYDDIMPDKFVLPDGSIIYTPKDSEPFIIFHFSNLEPIEA